MRAEWWRLRVEWSTSERSWITSAPLNAMKGSAGRLLSSAVGNERVRAEPFAEVELDLTRSWNCHHHRPVKGSVSVAVASSVRGFMRLLCGGWLLHGCASATASTRPPKVAVVDARWCIGGEELVATGWSVPYGADRRFEGAHDRFRGRAVLRRARRDIRRGHPNAARARLLREGNGDHAYAAALGHTAIGDAQFGDPRTRNSACADYGRAMSLLGIGFFGHFRAGTSPDRGLTSYLGYMLAWCSATQPIDKQDRARFEVDPWDAHILRFVVALRSSAREVRDLDEYAGLHEVYEGTLERVFALVPEDREPCVRNVGTGHPVDCSALSFGKWDAASLCGR